MSIIKDKRYVRIGYLIYLINDSLRCLREFKFGNSLVQFLDHFEDSKMKKYLDLLNVTNIPAYVITLIFNHIPDEEKGQFTINYKKKRIFQVYIGRLNRLISSCVPFNGTRTFIGLTRGCRSHYQITCRVRKSCKTPRCFYFENCQTNFKKFSSMILCLNITVPC